MSTTGARICTAIFAPLPFSAVWEVALHAAVDGAPPVPLVAAGVAPQVIAVLGLALWYLDPANRRSEPTVPAPQQVRRQVTADRRRELAR